MMMTRRRTATMATTTTILVLLQVTVPDLEQLPAGNDVFVARENEAGKIIHFDADNVIKIFILVAFRN